MTPKFKQKSKSSAVLITHSGCVGVKGSSLMIFFFFFKYGNCHYGDNLTLKNKWNLREEKKMFEVFFFFLSFSKSRKSRSPALILLLLLLLFYFCYLFFVFGCRAGSGKCGWFFLLVFNIGRRRRWEQEFGPSIAFL